MLNERLKLEIIKLDNFGRGIARLDNLVVFIEDTLPQEIVDVEIIKVKKNYLEGKIINYIRKSIHRRNNLCTYSEKCGGCPLINLNYDKQIKYKEDKIKELFTKNFQEEYRFNPIIGNNKEFNYRNKITLHCNNIELGLYEKNSNTIVSINKCLLVNDKINSIITLLNKLIKQEDISISSIIIKWSNTEQILLSINGKCNKKIIKDTFLGVDTIILNDKVIVGNGYIIEKVFDMYFNVSKDSFFQVNSDMIETLYSKVLSYIEDKNFSKILDLYCGTGTISLLASKYAKEVIGIEIVEEAIKDAEENKKINNISNISFICGKVEDNIDKFNDIDLIIVDPPRSGLDTKTINNILKILPNDLVYVSCDPITLIRDLKLLEPKYNIIEVTPVDMFPNTYHVECIVYLKSKENI